MSNDILIGGFSDTNAHVQKMFRRSKVGVKYNIFLQIRNVMLSVKCHDILGALITLDSHL